MHLQHYAVPACTWPSYRTCLGDWPVLSALGNLPGLFIPFWIFGSKNVHCAVVTRHADEGSVRVEVNAAEKSNEALVSCGCRGARPQPQCHSAWAGVLKPPRIPESNFKHHCLPLTSFPRHPPTLATLCGTTLRVTAGALPGCQGGEGASCKPTLRPWGPPGEKTVQGAWPLEVQGGPPFWLEAA